MEGLGGGELEGVGGENENKGRGGETEQNEAEEGRR